MSHKAAKPEKQDASSIPSFDQSLPMTLLRARAAAMIYFRPVFAEADLTEQQWRVLRALADVEQSDITSLAHSCHLLLPSISGILKRLEARGLVARKTNGADQRSSLILLTSEARQLINRVSPRLQQCYTEIEAKVGAKKLSELYSLLADIETELSE